MKNPRRDDSLPKSRCLRSKKKTWFTLSIAACVQLAIAASSGLLRDGCIVAAQNDTKTSSPDQETIQRGRKLFDANCSGCHGADGHGGTRGPSLGTGRLEHGNSDRALFRTITKGLNDTSMPPFRLRDEEVWDIISFLRVVRGETQRMDPLKIESGKGIFFGRGNCSRCHMLDGQGGRLGPDLSSTDSSMTTEYLAQSIRNPSASLPVDRSATEGIGAARLKKYAKVTLVDRNGKRITGVRLNEDSFSVQLMDQQESIHLALKHDLKEVIYHQESMMPLYDEKMLSNADLENLIAFVGSLNSK